MDDDSSICSVFKPHQTSLLYDSALQTFRSASSTIKHIFPKAGPLTSMDLAMPDVNHTGLAATHRSQETAFCRSRAVQKRFRRSRRY
jgi:hypothetical protein